MKTISKKQAKNKSNLSYIDAMLILTGEQSFHCYSNEDLDFIYFCAFGVWSQHMSREGYIHYLNIKRDKLYDERLEFMTKHNNN